jgi:hypothetical protein
MIDVAPQASLVRRLPEAIWELISRYRVSLLVLVLPAVATWIARRALGADATPAEIDELGYGLPPLLDGHVWTLFTGAFVVKSLTVSFVPSFSFIGVVLLEHRARHWRTLVAFLGGQVCGVLLALLLTAPLDGVDSAFANEMTDTVDFGFSVGGFAALGMWTCYLRAPLRRPLRWAIGCYLACQLLLSGLIYDVSHPIGWTLGIVVGARLMRPEHPDPVALRVPRDLWWIALGVVIGLGIGIVAAWDAGGIGGPFGWGPGAP